MQKAGTFVPRFAFGTKQPLHLDALSQNLTHTSAPRISVHYISVRKRRVGQRYILWFHLSELTVTKLVHRSIDLVYPAVVRYGALLDLLDFAFSLAFRLCIGFAIATRSAFIAQFQRCKQQLPPLQRVGQGHSLQQKSSSVMAISALNCRCRE